MTPLPKLICAGDGGTGPRALRGVARAVGRAAGLHYGRTRRRPIIPLTSTNQITAFHPGAMQHAHVNRIAEAREFAIGIVAPDGRQGMGAIKIEARGTQNHRFTPEEFEQRFAADFGSLESVILK